MSDRRIVLASASPRRLELLRQIGVEPEVRPAALPETAIPGETPPEHALRLATEKGRAVAGALAGDPFPAVVVAADTVVVIDGTPLGKPATPEEARSMLRRLSGRDHHVLTATWVGRTDDRREASEVESSRVRFHACPESVVRWYVSTGEPMDKAGAYAVQGLGTLLVAAIDGSWTNVVGLPVERLHALLARIGVGRGPGCQP
jgi:septum formation protein